MGDVAEDAERRALLEVEEYGQELELRAPAQIALVPDVTAADLVKRLAVIREAMRDAMEKDVDYGIIPGTNKPALLKPGSEKLGVLFQLDMQLENEKIWHDDGHLTVISRAQVFHAPTGARLGGGEGICTTKEAKYAFRKMNRVCPACGAAAIIKGKSEYGGGWLCWKNHKTTPGCGTKFSDGDQAIEGQPTGEIPNDKIADSWNTVDKMASKRARIDAVLAVTGASALFTQDVEDSAETRAASESAEKGAGMADPRPAPDTTVATEHAAALDAVIEGIAVLDGDPNWSLAAVIDSAVKSFKRPVAELSDLSTDELLKIAAVMPQIPF